MDISESRSVSDDIEGTVVPLGNLRGEGVNRDPVPRISGEDGDGRGSALAVGGAKLG